MYYLAPFWSAIGLVLFAYLFLPCLGYELHIYDGKNYIFYNKTSIVTKVRYSKSGVVSLYQKHVVQRKLFDGWKYRY